MTGAFDFDGAAAAAAVAAAAAAVVTGTTGAATGGTNSIARALDSIVASASAAGSLGGLHSPSGSNTPLAANLGVMGTLAQQLSATTGDAKKGDDEHALASMLGGLSQVLGTAATEAEQEAILSMARSGIGTGGSLTPAQAAAAAMQAAAVNTMQAQQQAQQQQAAKAVKAAAAASERAVTARYAAKSVAPRAPPPAENASGDIIEATTEPLDLARYLDAVRGGYDGEDSGPELATLISTVDSKHGDKQPLGESLAQHGALVEGALLRISQAIRKRWNCRRMALVLRLGAASLGDVSLIVACSANKWRDAAGAAEHAAIEIKDKLIASIAPQCLSKQPMAAAALKAVAAAAGVGGDGGGKPPKNDDEADEGDGVASGGEDAKEADDEANDDEEGEGNDDGAAAAMDALADPGRTFKGGAHPASVEVKSEDSEPKGLDTPDERAHA